MPVPSPMYSPGGSLKKFGTDSKVISGELLFAFAGPLAFWENAGTEKPRTMSPAMTRRTMPASNRDWRTLYRVSGRVAALFAVESCDSVGGIGPIGWQRVRGRSAEL